MNAATLSLFDDLALLPATPSIHVRAGKSHFRKKATRKPAVPAAPSAGRLTSTEALERHVQSGSRATNKWRVLAALAQHDGATAAELAAVAGLTVKPGLEEVETRRRLDDLRREGRVHQGERRQCRTKTRRARALTWWVGAGTAQTQNP